MDFSLAKRRRCVAAAPMRCVALCVRQVSVYNQSLCVRSWRLYARMNPTNVHTLSGLWWASPSSSLHTKHTHTHSSRTKYGEWCAWVCVFISARNYCVLYKHTHTHMCVLCSQTADCAYRVSYRVIGIGRIGSICSTGFFFVSQWRGSFFRWYIRLFVVHSIVRGTNLKYYSGYINYYSRILGFKLTH